ncbi:RNA-directed DNA polymerase [bacterium]|nr:RNA-directed DNA polymerase [bacterium]
MLRRKSFYSPLAFSRGVLVCQLFSPAAEQPRQASKNYSNICLVLKCDIRKFFENIDHAVLLKILGEYIVDKDILILLDKIISSFEVGSEKGLPLGNLTSQLFVNIYMNKFDQFVKHKIKAKYYIRYADDFVFLSDSKTKLEKYLLSTDEFLKNELKLELHPNKIFIKTIASGIDFLGWINFPYHTVLRAKTKRRMLNRLKKNAAPESLASYLGLLSHGNTYDLQKQVLNDYWFWRN